MFLRAKLLILLGIASTVLAGGVFAQAWTYTVTDNTAAGQNPGGLNTDGDTSLTNWDPIGTTALSANTWTADQTIPFAFEFYGQAVTSYKVSHNGVVTFNTGATALPGANENLPSTELPDNSIAMFWDEFATNPPTGANDQIYKQTYGTAPNRQHWIKFHSFEIASRSYAYFAMCIEETTNKVYVVDMGYYFGAGTTTVGVQQDSSTAVQFGDSNLEFVNSSSSVTDNGYYEFTPFQLVDELVPTGNPVAGTTASGDTGVVLGAFDLEARNTAAQSVSSLTVTQSGSTASSNVTNVTLWHDQNGNGVVDSGEPQLDSVANLTGDTATFSGSPLISISAGSTESVVVTADIGAGVSASETVGFEISASGDITTTPGPVSGTFPVDGGSLSVVVFSSSLPFIEDFDGASLAPNFGFQTAPGEYPTSTGVGNTPSSDTSTSNGTAFVTDTGGITPQSGTDYVWTWHASESAVALDTRMDLSAYDVSTDTIEFRFSYWVDGLDITFDEFNYAFISVDGGQTWIDTLFDIDESAPSGWQLATVDVSAALSAASSNFTNRVVLRVQVADNDDLDFTYFEDIGVREIPASLEVNGSVPPNNAAPFAIEPSGDVEVLDLALTANLNDQTVDEITVTNSGTVADAQITDVKLWEDTNDNGVVDSGESQLGTTQQLSGGTATFDNLNMVITAGNTENLLVTYAFAAGASGTIGCEVASAGDIVSTPDPVQATFGQTFPVGGDLGDVLEPVSALPYTENFDGSNLAKNVGRVVEAGTYPTATSVGGSTSTDTTTNDGNLEIAGSTGGTAPNSGANQAVFNFPNSQAAAAMDFHFDLSAYSAASDQIEFTFAWTDDGLDGGTTNEPFDYVFVSTDGGTTWETAVFYIDPDLETSIINNFYSGYTVDVSAVLDSVGADYTSETVIRVQAADNLSSDYLMVDDVQLDLIPPTAPTIGSPTAAGSGVPEHLYYKFNEGSGTTTANDAQPGQGSANPTFNGTWETPGQLGAAAAEFASSSDSIDTGWSFNFGTSDSWTIEFWMNKQSTLSRYPFGYGTASTLGMRGYWFSDDMHIYGTGGSNISSTGDMFTPNAWHHVAFVYDAGASESRVYHNGTLNNTIAGTQTIDASTFFVGSRASGDASYFDGTIDEFRFWDTARSDTEIQDNMNSEVTDIPGLNLSGSGSSYTATVDLGGDLDFFVSADDVNTQDTLTWTVTDLGTGSLTPAQAGFDQTFTAGVYDDPNPDTAPPHMLELSGIAQDTGTIDLELEVTDGTFTETVTLSITIQLGSQIIRDSNVSNMDFTSYSIGSPSTVSMSYDIEGYALTSDLVVTAPTDFEVSLNSTSGFGGSINLTPAGANGIVATTTIHVRYNPATAGPHTQDVVNSSTGANDVDIAVNGDIVPMTAPVIEAPNIPLDTADVLFTEIAQDPGSSAHEFMEVTNVSSSPVDIAGWTLLVYSSTPTPFITHTITGTTLQPGDTYVFCDNSSTYVSVEDVGTNIVSWNDHAIVLLDGNGNVQDVAATGSMDPTQITSPLTITSQMWSGAGIPNPGFTDSVIRTGTDDNNDASDWSQPGGDTLGVLNTGLSLPFSSETYINVSGSLPNLTGQAYVGESLEMTFDATDVNTLEDLTFTVEVTGGSLTAAQAGFNQTFTGGIYDDPSPGQSPHSLMLNGTAAQAGTIDLTVTVEDSTALQDTYDIALTILPVPTITTTGTLDPFFATAVGTPSPEQDFEVSAVDLVDDLVVTAPAEFEVSLTSGSGFGGSVTITPTGGSVAATTIFVRYNPTSSGPLLAQPLVVTSTDAQSASFDLDGYIGSLPTLSTSLTPLSTFTTDATGNPSAEQVFNVDATDLVDDITVTAPAEFEVSLSSGTGFGSSVTISQANPLNTTTVFVRYNPTASGPHSGDITIATAGPVSTTVAVDGEISSSSGGGGGGGGSDDGGGCVAGSTESGMWGLLLGALALLFIALRVRAVRE